MRAILVHAENKTVEEVHSVLSLDEIYRLLECSCFTIAGYFDNGDVVYADDEALLKDPKHFISLGVNNGHPFAGNALIVGTSNQGETISCESIVQDIKQDVIFMDRVQAVLWARNNYK